MILKIMHQSLHYSRKIPMITRYLYLSSRGQKNNKLKFFKCNHSNPYIYSPKLSIKCYR